MVKIEDVHWTAKMVEYLSLPLSWEGTLSGEMNRSPVLSESDLAPLKPACDIIINGTAYTPGGIA
ncbi:DUF2169 domain-containing protein, partial [Escherichia coli]|uniref:DUF2169 domain-containing protein n=1 Tax=Escherichia coli TaxID=562 RepID=UPI0010CC1EDB